MRRFPAAAAIVLAFASTTPAKADPYRWCAEAIGQSGATNCYFPTLEQCRAAVSGAGGFCTPNPFYTGSDAQSGRRIKRR
jgi:hypothetical protein